MPGAEEAIVREVAVSLAQPYGIIQARERVMQMGSASGDPRYRCLVEYYDYWRSYDPEQHARVRDCLERTVAADPSFAAGYSSLAEIVLQEHRRGLNTRPGDAPPSIAPCRPHGVRLSSSLEARAPIRR